MLVVDLFQGIFLDLEYRNTVFVCGTVLKMYIAGKMIWQFPYILQIQNSRFWELNVILSLCVGICIIQRNMYIVFEHAYGHSTVLRREDRSSHELL